MNTNSQSNRPLNATNESFEWDVFLSHNSTDKTWVTDLAAQLESELFENKPESRKIRVFLDAWDIDAGENIVIKLNEGLLKSRFVAIIMSPEFFRSNWTAFEWTHCVADDPRNTRGRLIPILHRDISIDGMEAISLPAPFRATKHLDFRTVKSQNVSYRELLHRIRGLPIPRGPKKNPTPGTFERPATASIVQERWKADHVSELLISNLLPVVGLPERIWSGATTFQKTKQVYEQVDSGDGIIIQNGRLYTFAHLNDPLCPLRSVIDTNTISDNDKRDEWLADKTKSPLYTWLLNSCLRRYLREIGLDQDEKHRFFFPPLKSPTWSFSPKDFGDLSSLATRLRSSAEPISRFVFERLSSGTRTIVKEFQGEGTQASILRNALSDDFNALLQSGPLFDEERFPNATLRAETRELLSCVDDWVRLNRLLIEDAYRKEIMDARRVILDGREVTGRKPSPQPNQDFWVHWAAEIRFSRIGTGFFLRITPCFFFTHDGVTPLDGKKMGKLSIRWGGSQRNSNILRDLLFWANLLRRNRSEIVVPAGAEGIRVRPLPATTRCNRGIKTDHIRFSKLMQFTSNELERAAADIQITPTDEDEGAQSEE